MALVRHQTRWTRCHTLLTVIAGMRTGRERGVMRGAAAAMRVAATAAGTASGLACTVSVRAGGGTSAHLRIRTRHDGRLVANASNAASPAAGAATVILGSGGVGKRSVDGCGGGSAR